MSGTSIIKRVVAALAIVLGLAGTNAGAETILSVTQTNYDGVGRVNCTAVRMNMAITQPADPCTPSTTVGNDGPDRISKNVYDSAGQLLAVYQGVGTSDIRQYAYYNYTNNGLKSFEIDANHNKTTFTYDGFDRLSQVQYPNTTVGNEISSTTDFETFGYDANSNRTNWRRRSGATITYAYDNLNRQVHEGGSYSADMDTAYDLQGRVKYKHFSTGGLGVDYTYDGLGRVTSTTDMNGRTVAYQYDAASSRTRFTYPDGNYLGYAYNYRNQLRAVNVNGNNDWLFTQDYDQLGRRYYVSRGLNGIAGLTTYAYDNLGRLTSFANNPAGTTYDVTWTFSGRNPAGQITTWGNSNSLYDYVESAVSTDNKTYDGLNRDASIAAVTGGYDANGNMAKDGARVMTYDFYNRLISVAAPSTPTAPYLTLAYDTEGRLASYAYAGQTTEFLYDGTSLIGEYNHVPGTLHNSDTMAARYIHDDGVDEPLVWFAGNSVASPRFFYANYQGSITAYTDANGGVYDYYKYGPYGEPINNNNSGQTWTGPRFRYTGQVMLGEAKLYYYKARVYDPNMGRFLQTDPVGSKDDLDLYAYVGGDPVNSVDPTGTQTGSILPGGSSITSSYLGGSSAQVAQMEATDKKKGWDKVASDIYDAGDKDSNVISFISGGAASTWNDFYSGATQEGFAVFMEGGFDGVAVGRAFEVGGDAAKALKGLCCFVSGTLVSTEAGLIPIEKIVVGDLVLSKDPSTGEMAFKAVLSTTPSHRRIIYKLTTEVELPDGTKRKSVFETTDDHPWRTSDGEWVETRNLIKGRTIQTAYGKAVNVLAVVNTGNLKPTYNIEVADFHTYFVGEDRVWVHNSCDGITGLVKQMRAHEAKLAEFLANPTVRKGMENLSPDIIKAAQARRIAHLQREIKAFQGDIIKKMQSWQK